jgi:superfamily II DNA/RNA helicase
LTLLSTHVAHRRRLPSLAELGVSAAVVSRLAQRGIETATPIQIATIPDGLAGRDVVGSAPTGTGKTLAFGIVLLARIKAKQERSGRGPRGLVLAPTRELAQQIHDALAPLAAELGQRIAVVYGGVGYGSQRAALRRNPDVVVATPGRLRDLVEQGDVRLDAVGVLVVDEVDRMADMGFRPEVRWLAAKTAEARQTLLFSATFDAPVERLARELCHQPQRHVVEAAPEAEGRVEHHFWRVDAATRVEVAAEAIRSAGPAVVFCRTRRGADRLAAALRQAGLEASPIHGDLPQRARERALEALRRGRLDALVATDVAARGIHVDDVPLVVHFDPAERPTDYLHRSGRTGRAGKTGSVVSLVGPRDGALLRAIGRELGVVVRAVVPDPTRLPRTEPVSARDDRSATASRMPRIGTELEDRRRSSSSRAEGGRAGQPRQSVGQRGASGWGRQRRRGLGG